LQNSSNFNAQYLAATSLRKMLEGSDYWKISAENFFGFCAIENVSNNNIILNNIIKKTKPLIISPTAYFFYNFAYPTFDSEKVLIIN
jgi:hypothetical protein